MLKQIFLVTLLSFFVSSCATFEEPEFIRSEGVKMEKMDGQEIFFSAGVRVMNPNWYGIKIKPSKIDVYLEDQLMGQVSLKKRVKMKAKQESSLTLPLLAELEDGAMLTLLRYANKENITVRFKGKVKGGIWFFSKKIEIDETKKISGKDLKFELPK